MVNGNDLSESKCKLGRGLCVSMTVAFSTVVAVFLIACVEDVFADKPAVSIADAAEHSKWSEIKKLIDTNADVNAKQPDGMTALHWAVYRNHRPTVDRLIKAKCAVTAKTEYNVTPLSIACELGYAGIVKRLVDAGADPNDSLPGGETALMKAARNGSADAVRYLIEAGADVDARERRGQTALMWASAAGNVDAVDILLDAKADPKITLKSGFTAMFFAARHGQTDVAKQLVRAGVDLNAAIRVPRSRDRQPRNGMSALMFAVESGHFELALELVRMGANPNDQRSGYAPLHTLSWVRRPKRGDGVDGDPPPRGSGRVTSLQFVRKLVAMGADVNLGLKNGSGGRAEIDPKEATPFLLAAKTADLPFMKLLHELGADPLKPNVDGCTPLMAAAGVGVKSVDEEPGTSDEVIACLNLLVDLGGDVNTVDKNNETVMHGAAYRSYPEVAVRLAELGADPIVWNRKNKWGWTPIRIAEGYRPGSFKPSPKMIKALQAAMAESQ